MTTSREVCGCATLCTERRRWPERTMASLRHLLLYTLISTSADFRQKS